MKKINPLIVILSICMNLVIACHPMPKNSAKSNAESLQIETEKRDVAEAVPTPASLRDGGEQKSFHMEEGIWRPVAIPEGIFQSIFDSGAPIPTRCRTDQNSCFVASKINLNNDNYPDLLVMGRGALLGANITSFWIFAGTDHAPKLILIASGLELTIGIKRFKKFYDIDTVSLTASEIFTSHYQFDGKKYLLKSEKRERI